MAQLKVGLAPNRTSYFDQNTLTYLTLSAPVQTITYDETDVAGTLARLERITHALLASVPAIVLYEGQLPQESIDAWKSKYLKPFSGPATRNIVSGGKVIGTVPITDPVRNNFDHDGREIEPNRAFDRAAKKEAKGATTLSTKEAVAEKQEEKKEEVKAQEVVQEAVQETEETAQANARTQRKQNTTAKAEK